MSKLSRKTHKGLNLRCISGFKFADQGQCDEQKPTCGTCQRLRRACREFRPPLRFHAVLMPTKKACSSDTQEPVNTSSSLTREIRFGSRTGLTLPRSALVEALQHTERDIFYTTCCEDRCLPALHPIFHQVLQISSQSAMLKHTILALASGNISRSTAEYKTSRSIECLGAFRPNLVHQTRSQLYYSRAIQEIASLSHENYQQDSSTVLAVVVLFAYIECSVGNLAAFESHIHGLVTLMNCRHNKKSEPFIRTILMASMQPRFAAWWSRAYYSSVDVQRNLPQLTLPAMFPSDSDLPEARRVQVLSIMYESHRLNVKAALIFWGTLQKATDNSSKQGFNDHTITDGLLTIESRKLDHWLALMQPSERPFMEEVNVSENGAASTSMTAKIRFRSHDAALNYAYYVVARVMQCTSFLRHLPTQDPTLLGYECAETEPWIRLLLEIVQGIDMQTALLRNVYTIGFSNLLLAACLRCQSQSVSLAIESWLQALEHLSPTEEGGFPIFQALSVMKAINAQRMIGRDVFGVSQPVDNVGGPKFACYCSQPISSLLLHGKVRSSGIIFTSSIAIDGQLAEI